ncbi:copper resistance CopC/CopD family protein [Streptomyces sp. NPDC057616]|uniref:copper resistance CopC/CopD family protein n=1 Tax=Streptomyces sp. NPDC057616 TaxID=3346183 RepID=UPI00369E1AB0
MRKGSPTVRKPLTALTLVAAVIALLLGGAGAASAHASLTGSDPADGSVVRTAPKQVTLTFSESVTFPDGALRVLSPDNERVNPRGPEHADGKGNTARVALQGKLVQGTYTVAWRAISADSHPISGAFTFSVGKPSETTAVVSTGTPDDTAASHLYDFFRYGAYSGLALLVGVTAFVLLCWPDAGGGRAVRRLLTAGWAALLASTVALLLLRGPYESGGSPMSAFDLSLLGRTVTGRPSVALLARLVLLAGAAVLLKRPGGGGGRSWAAGVRGRVTGALFAVGLAVTWAVAEHASAGAQVALAIPVAVLHLLAMAVWMGGLVTLLVLLRGRASGIESHGSGSSRSESDGSESDGSENPASETPASALPASAIARFSTVAFRAVVVLVGTGVYQSWRQVGSWSELSTTSYGRTLTLKLAAVILVLTAAAFSRQWTARLLGSASATTTPEEEQGQHEPERVRVKQTVGGAAVSDTTVSGTAGASGKGGEGAAGAGTVETGPDSEAGHRRSLRRTVAAEAVLGVVVLAITTVLTGTQPSRAEAAVSASAAAAQAPEAKVVMVPFDLGGTKGHGSVQITLSPGRVGDNTVQAIVFAGDGGISTVPELRLTLTQRAQDIGPLDAKLKDQKGYWASYDLRLPLPGVWTMKLTVRTTDIDQVTVSKTVTVTDLPGRPATS